MSLTIDENGKALTETVEGCTMPADYSFACVNDFVHAHGTNFEELQALCLGMANEIELLKTNRHSPGARWYCVGREEPVLF